MRTTMAEPAAAPNKRALLIGINKYPNLPAYSQLRGCVNDVQLVKQTLETSFHFSPDNIVVLSDGQATAQGIRDAMEKLVADCQQDDIVVFHFSGHGSQMAAEGDKPRGYDESIMPYDSGRMNPMFPVQVAPCDIRDTYIQRWLSRLTAKTSHVTLIFDSCHSGSITRMSGDSEEQSTRLRWIPPDPLPNGDLPAYATGRSGRTRDVNAGSGWLSLSDKYVLLAACAAEQGAYEMDHEEEGAPSRNGAFTFFLTREINQTTQSAYQDIWDIVSLKVNNRFPKQTPQLEGARNRQIFDVQDFTPMRYLLVTERRGNELQLAGGAVHGVTVGSLWEIHAVGVRQVTKTKPAWQGVVEITSVKSISSSAVVIEESADAAIVQGTRATEILRADGETRMSVWLEPVPGDYEQACEDLRQALKQSNLLRITESGAAARAIISIALPNAAKPEPNHVSGEPMWAVLDQSQALLTPQYSVTSPEAKLRIRENLETIWRYVKVQELRNEKSALKGKVDFVLLKKNLNGEWQEAAKRGVPVYKEGDGIAFRVVNRSGVPIHISVLDLGLSKRISLLYPPAGASETIGVPTNGNETITAGRSGGAANDVPVSGILSVGERPESEIELFFPENLTFLTTSKDAGPLSGKEIFKLCVTTERHDLGFLTQSGLRTETASEAAHPLERLLYLATSSGLTRETRLRLAPRDEWFTIERPFFLERNQ